MATDEIALSPIRACLFDMDGLLINSEDLYSQVTNTILAELDRPMLPWSIKAKLQGRSAHFSIALLMQWANLPISTSEWCARSDALQRELFPSSTPLPGVIDLLQTLLTAGVEIAVATSSHSSNYAYKTSHLQKELFDFFPPGQIIKGDDPRITHGRGKPAPDIYLLALETINARRRAEGKDEIEPREALVFEDAVPGVEAGRRAGMRVVWVPHEELLGEYKGREEEVLAGLCQEYVEGEIKGGKPGVLEDGWGELRSTLVGFDYERYGIKAWNGVVKN
ncbi:putative haloacid-halidohydrolase [Terfezia claveryi]|nr:putative haloacid-halidohydrolase [Terfezia claveryi]